MTPSLPPLPRGLVLAAPRSGSGKTVLSLGLIRALRRRGLAVQPFKNGPDYIDPAFHRRAAGRESFNLDSWAMPQAAMLASILSAGAADVAVLEGSMGLFDGVATPGAGGTGASADVAALTGWPVLLVLDVSGQAQSAAAVALGCARLRPDIAVMGVVLNKLGSDRHRRLAAGAVEAAGLPVLGAVPRDARLVLPERHLGLVQAAEHGDLDGLIETFADAVSAHLDLDRVLGALPAPALARSGPVPASVLPPPAQHVAVAADDAFSFFYPHVARAWREAGAELSFFSPLADEAPAAQADLVWLPGGYPELYAGRLAGNGRFLDGLRRHAGLGRPIHGECGGYMVLGRSLIDADGQAHRMAGLLGLVSDFSRRRLHLGYRRAALAAAHVLGPAGSAFRGHEFHYAAIADAGGDAPLFIVEDADGRALPEGGSRRGPASGSFFHLIARDQVP